MMLSFVAGYSTAKVGWKIVAMEYRADIEVGRAAPDMGGGTPPKAAASTDKSSPAHPSGSGHPAATRAARRPADALPAPALRRAAGRRTGRLAGFARRFVVPVSPVVSSRCG